MNRSETTAWLSVLLEKYIDPKNDPRIYWSKEVTFDYGTEDMVRVDYIRFKPLNNTVSGIEKGDFYCYEIKSSVEDFRSKNGHNFLGDYNYYVMPGAVYEAVKKEIGYKIGVLVPQNNLLSSYLTTVQKAQRADRSKPVSEMLLMMYRSSRRLDVKLRRQKKEDEYEDE